MQTPSRIFLVDDHPIVRQGLMMLLAQEADLAVCGEAETVEQGWEGVLALKPDLVILDISLEGADGIQLIKKIRSESTHPPILVFSMHDELVYSERAVQAGANGYVMKGASAETVRRSIRQALRGETYLSEAVKANVVQKYRDGIPDPRDVLIQQLPDRALEVFRLIGGGCGRREIAQRLNVRPKTVDAHREKIKRKLGINSSVELVRCAVQWVEGQS